MANRGRARERVRERELDNDYEWKTNESASLMKGKNLPRYQT